MENTLKKAELKKLRSELMASLEKIQAAINPNMPQTVECHALSNAIASHLFDAAALIHVFWELAPKETGKD